MSLPLTVNIAGPVTGKGRHRTTRSGHTYTPEKTASAQNRVAHELAIAWRQPPCVDALSLTVEIRVPVPVSKSKKFRDLALASGVFPTSKPDIDNVVKLLADAGNKIVWNDDAQITRLFVSRRYAADPGMTVTVERA
jgi:Holliday junction resolvase RusA-like endonuclease